MTTTNQKGSSATSGEIGAAQDRRALELALGALIAAQPRGISPEEWERHEQAINAAGCALNKPARTTPAPQAPTVTKAEIYTLRRLIECAEKLNERPRPMCRDCGDEDGTCPHSGLECGMRKLFAAAKALHNKLASPVAAPEAPAFLGMRLVVDPSMAPDTVRMVSGNNSVTMVNLGTAATTASASGPMDEWALFNAAINATYPIPDNPHASVIQRAMDDRIAFRLGWGQARAALARQGKP